MHNGQKTNLEVLLEQEKEILHLKQLLRQALLLLAGNPHVYATSASGVAWHQEAQARARWREQAQKALQHVE